jgi:MurNAc alpha-1-phosphate uridylyltransferase
MTAPIDTIFLFAAGKGTRMSYLTENSPKTLLSVAGKPILYQALELCKSYPFKKIVINTHYLSEKIDDAIDLFSKNNPNFPEIIIIHEKELLETGGAIKNAINIIGENPIFTLNTDVILKSDNNIFEHLCQSWNKIKMDFMLLLQPFDKAIGYRGRGDFEIDHDGRLHRPLITGNYTYMYAGLQIIHPLQIINNPLKVFSLSQYYTNENSRIFGAMLDGVKWYHATTPEDISVIEAAMQTDF